MYLSNISIFDFFFSLVSIAIFLSLANNGCSASNTGKKFSLAGRDNYLGFPNQKLTLTWNYTGTEMYKTVVIAVSTPPLDMALKKLWSISYNPKDNTTTVKDLSDSSTLFNEITEIHRTLKVFKLVIKSVPRSLASFRISCKAQGTSFFDIGEHTASVIVAGEFIFLHSSYFVICQPLKQDIIIIIIIKACKYLSTIM